MGTGEREAAAMLAGARRAQDVVERTAPKEEVPFFIWGLFHLVVIPGFDFVDPHRWGWVTIAAATVGFVVTAGYFIRRLGQLRIEERTPWWTWPAVTLYGAAVAAGVFLLDDGVTPGYTVGGILIALPLLGIGMRLRRTR